MGVTHPSSIRQYRNSAAWVLPCACLSCLHVSVALCERGDRTHACCLLASSLIALEKPIRCSGKIDEFIGDARSVPASCHCYPPTALLPKYPDSSLAWRKIGTELSVDLTVTCNITMGCAPLGKTRGRNEVALTLPIAKSVLRLLKCNSARSLTPEESDRGIH